jgi:hypothetical protein
MNWIINFYIWIIKYNEEDGIMDINKEVYRIINHENGTKTLEKHNEKFDFMVSITFSQETKECDKIVMDILKKKFIENIFR